MISVDLENLARPGIRHALHEVQVDTGSHLTWVPAPVLEALGIQHRRQMRFRQPNGAVLTRWVGAALLYVADTLTADDVVFAEPEDRMVLGARTLRGLNLRVDPVLGQLVDAGPIPAALAH